MSGRISLKRNSRYTRITEFWRVVRDIAPLLAVSGVTLGFLNLYSYAKFLGRPELFLDSVAIGPNLFAWSFSFVFLLAVYFSMVLVGSLIYVCFMRIFKPIKALSLYLSNIFVLGLVLGLGVFWLSVVFERGLFFTMASVYLSIVIFVLVSFYFSRPGNMYVRRVSRRQNKRQPEASVVKNDKDRRPLALKHFQILLLKLTANKFLRFIYSFIMCVSEILKITAREVKKIILKYKSQFLLSIVALALGFFIFCAFCLSLPSMQFVLKSAEIVGEDAGYKAAMAVFITVQYGILPGVIFYRAKGEVVDRLKKLLVACVMSVVVVFTFTPGLYKRIVFSTASVLGLQTVTKQKYLVNAKVFTKAKAFSSWNAVMVSNDSVEVEGVVLFRFSGVIYLCPSSFETMNAIGWAEHSSMCFITSGSNVKTVPE